MGWLVSICGVVLKKKQKGQKNPQPKAWKVVRVEE
jgi:hypothetical protein